MSALRLVAVIAIMVLALAGAAVGAVIMASGEQRTGQLANESSERRVDGYGYSFERPPGWFDDEPDGETGGIDFLSKWGAQGGVRQDPAQLVLGLTDDPAT